MYKRIEEKLSSDQLMIFESHNQHLLDLLTKDEVDFLRGSGFESFFREHKMLIEVLAAFYYSEMRNFDGISRHPNTMKELMRIELRRVGTGKHMKELKRPSITWDEKKIDDVFSKGLIDEALLRGIPQLIEESFKEVN